MASAMTEYERQRAENIKQNQALLQSLDLKALGGAVGLKRSASTRSATPGSTGGATKRARTKNPPKPREKALPSRASARISGLKATEEELEQKREEDEKKAELERRERTKRKHEDRRFGAEALLVRDDEEWLTNGMWAAWEGIADGIKRETNGDAKTSWDDYASLKKEFASLSLEAFSKVTPNRVYCSAFHPTVDKDLIVMGDKLGAVGVWDATSSPSVPPVKTDEQDVDAKAANKAEPDEEEEADEEDADAPNRGNAFVIQAHSRNAISAIKTDPLNPHQVYTASYDSTIRLLNFETHMSVEVVDGDRLDNNAGEALFSAIDFSNGGRELWASDNDGGLTHRDLRQPKGKARRWQIQEKKVGCVSLCPGEPRWAATAGLNREMRIWDLKALLGSPPASSISDNVDKACVSMYTHGLACSSAYWDPSGTRLLSTSYDDFVRVWDVKNELANGGQWEEELAKATVRVKHDNQTGRWVSVFKAQWCPAATDPAHFTIGNMHHKVDLYSAKGDLLAQLDHDLLTTVPAATAEHPVLGSKRVAGMTAGGKCYLWRRP